MVFFYYLCVDKRQKELMTLSKLKQLKMKRTLFLACLVAICWSSFAQPRYQKEQMALEKLNRGVVALRHDNQVVVSCDILFCAICKVPISFLQ